MKITIGSLKGSIREYEHLLRKKLDFDKHYRVIADEVREYDGLGGKKSSYHIFLDELVDVEVDSIEELFGLFDEFEEGMGRGFGHITVNVKTGEVQILDSWIE
jgi:hypothetical protein